MAMDHQMTRCRTVVGRVPERGRRPRDGRREQQLIRRQRQPIAFVDDDRSLYDRR